MKSEPNGERKDSLETTERVTDSERSRAQDGILTSRRGVLKALGLVAIGSIGLGGRARAQTDATSAIPTQPTFYQVRVVGQTSAGAFDQQGLFLVAPSAEITPTNPRDVGLTIGNPRGSPEVGSMEFYTNTALREQMGMGGSPTLNQSRIKIGTVQVDEAAGLLAAQPRADQGIDLPPGVNAGLQVNVFTPRAGIVAPLSEIVDGRLDAQFSGNQVAGQYQFLGVSLGGAATRETVTAQFAGVA